MWTVHQRMVELWFINKTRELTDSEMTEMSHCLSANTQRAWEIAITQKPIPDRQYDE